MEFLFELGTEEIPARMLRTAATDLSTAIERSLREAGVGFAGLELAYAPRQITLWSSHVEPRQADRREWVTGPPVAVAYLPDGSPAPALLAFLRKNPDLRQDQLQRRSEAKGEVLVAERCLSGEASATLLTRFLPAALAGLRFAKSMRWGQGDVVFVRPVHSLLALLGGEVLPFSFAGISSDRYSFGLRGRSSRFAVADCASYFRLKRENGIVIDHQERRTLIESQMKAHASSLGGHVVPDEELLEQVTDLVECPYVVLGSFEEAFLEIPREVLVTSLREHQKSFCLQDESGRLMPHFMAFANAPGDGMGLIRKGNEWVLRARLWDARFFWDSDRKKDLPSLREKLAQLSFQRQLGSYLEKVERMEQFAERLAERLAERGGLTEVEREALLQATHHAKTDLMSELVFEFPELQGMAGGLLLRAAGSAEPIAAAVYEHYLPNSSDGPLPATLPGALLSLLDKLDTLVGCFSIGLAPTGTKDPFALRRAALGVVRILMARSLPLSLAELVSWALAGFPQAGEETAGQVLDFLRERTRFVLRSAGFDHFQVEAVLAVDADRVDLTLPRLRALSRQMEKANFRALTLNLKRMKNAVADEVAKLSTFQPQLLQEEPERVLWQQFGMVRSRIEGALLSQQYDQAMDAMAELAQPVETYFSREGVFVNVPADELRLNRKAMLHAMVQTLLSIADFTLLEAAPSN
jgi:glycyl-tRNA synthetase beta chain